MLATALLWNNSTSERAAATSSTSPCDDSISCQAGASRESSRRGSGQRLQDGSRRGLGVGGDSIAVEFAMGVPNDESFDGEISGYECSRWLRLRVERVFG
eukprot:5560727-Pyramimonas_sp.AAC.1